MPWNLVCCQLLILLLNQEPQIFIRVLTEAHVVVDESLIIFMHCNLAHPFFHQRLCIIIVRVMVILLANVQVLSMHLIILGLLLILLLCPCILCDHGQLIHVTSNVNNHTISCVLNSNSLLSNNFASKNSFCKNL